MHDGLRCVAWYGLLVNNPGMIGGLKRLGGLAKGIPRKLDTGEATPGTAVETPTTTPCGIMAVGLRAATEPIRPSKRLRVAMMNLLSRIARLARYEI